MTVNQNPVYATQFCEEVTFVVGALDPPGICTEHEPTRPADMENLIRHLLKVPLEVRTHNKNRG